MNLVKFAVIGAGYGSAVLIPAIQEDKRAVVAAIIASNPQKADSTAKKHNIKTYSSDWKSFIASGEIDALAIAVPPLLQPEIIIAALERGIPVFAEKPLSAKIEDAEKIISCIKDKNIPNAVDFNFTGLPVFTTAKDIIKTGKLGDIRHVVVNWQVESYANRKKINNWKTDKNSGGGTLSNFVSHSFHYLEWLLEPIVNIFADLSKFPNDDRSGDVTAAICSKFKSGTTGMLIVSAGAFCGSGHEIEIYGEEGTLILKNDTADHMNGFRLYFAQRDDNELAEYPLEKISHHYKDSRIYPTSQLISQFIDWVDEDIPMDSDFNTGYRVQKMIEAANESNSKKKWVDIEDK